MENENTITTNENQPVQYAGFWWRFLAYIIDNIIVSFASWIVLLPIMGIFGISLYSMAESGYDLEDSPVMWGSIVSMYTSIFFVSIIINWLYYAIMESTKSQGTVGKLILKIKVTDYNYERITFGRATGRFFGKFISQFILLIGFIMAGFTERKQALHDMMASCYVIKEQ